MAHISNSKCLWDLSLLLFLSLYFHLSFSTSTPTSHVYIVYLGIKHIHDPVLTSNYHIQLLSNVFDSKEEAEESMLYSYKHSFSGFSAVLNSSQATTLTRVNGVISVFKSRTQVLHTTRSWDFMGLSLKHTTKDHGIPQQLSFGSDVIVGVFDSGIWPNSSSFQEDLNIGPIPSTWKGKCVSGENFDPKKSCNRKVIGARYYVKGIENEYGELNTTKFEYRSPLDFLGHGTHTSSTAVGSIVNNASFLGLGEGTARGGAPRARLAMYKVCWGDENYNGRCTDADIMAAFDDALNDGVNVISVSIGSPLPLAPFYESVADIGSFHAMQLGVSVVFSGGNDGPDLSLVRNVNPWSLCVAASTIDRTFPTRITLDNKLSFMGEGLLTKSISGKFVGAEPYFNGGVCRTENRKNRSAKGRIFLCMSSMGGVTSGEAQIAVRNISGTGLIFVDILSHQIPDVDILPTVLVDLIQGTQIANYLLDAFLTPKVVISASRTTTEVSQAPVVAYFSSRGPSSLSPDILKPDVSAPGVNILAAWPPKTPPTLLPFDINRSTSWNFQSGTSMSCPHVTGVVALIKSAHPHWSPAAIKSAIMTTAYRKDNSEDTILSGGSMKASDPFDIGSGHIDPLKALDPGLIYDLNTNDYILYLCNLGYAQDQINQMLSCPITTNCPKSHTNTNINYPSITISDLQSTMTIKRTVRNVGHKKTAFYFVKVISPNGVEVVVWPRILIFTCFKEEASYHVSFKPVKRSHGRYDFGEIVWSDGFHFVRSPLVVFVNTTYNGGAAPVLDTFSSGDPESI